MPPRTDISKHRRRRRRGYSLVELLVASASAAMLMGGLASALYLSGEALAPDHVSINASDASRVLATLRDDLRHATRITQLSGTSATFYTADRDGDGQQDKLRYAWSGEAGAPLVFEYNDGGERTLITSVQSFELAGMTRQFFAPALTAGEDAPKLMFVVTDEDSVTENEAAQFALFGGWGFDVTLVKQDEKSKDLEKEADKSAVVVISSDCTNTDFLGAELAPVSTGVVCEALGAADDLGLASAGDPETVDVLKIADNTHSITTGFATGEFGVASQPMAMHALTGSVAPSGATLATISRSGVDEPSLVAVEIGGALQGGGSAAGRRVMLPFGGAGFDASDLSTLGQTLLKQAVTWAAELGVPEGVRYLAFEEAKASSSVERLDVPVPASAEGDLLIAVAVTDSETDEDLSVNGSGWTRIDRGTGGEAVTLGVWWRLATASEPATYRFSHDEDEEMYCWIMRFDGHDPTDPIHAVAVGSGTSSSPDSPSVTTTVDNAMIVRIVGCDDDDVDVDDTGLADHTTITMDESGGGSDTCSGGAAYATQPLAGDAGVVEFQLTASEQHRCVTIAIAPEPDP